MTATPPVGCFSCGPVRDCDCREDLPESRVGVTDSDWNELRDALAGITDPLERADAVFAWSADQPGYLDAIEDAKNGVGRTVPLGEAITAERARRALGGVEATGR